MPEVVTYADGGLDASRFFSQGNAIDELAHHVPVVGELAAKTELDGQNQVHIHIA